MARHTYTIIALTVCLSFFSTTFAIDISGDLSGTLHTATYYVIGHIYIQPYNDLIIEPGCVFRFNGSYFFQIEGNLQAVGTEQDSIKFIPNTGINWWSGIRFLDMANPNSRMEYCLITGSGNHGISYNYAGPSLNHCTIIDNVASNGGGFWCDHYNPIINNCTISGNWANGEGGGIHLQNCSPTFNNCTIVDNSAGNYGGAFNCFVASPSINNCNISGNSSVNRGGAIYYFESGYTPTVTDCEITGNSVTNGYGGAVYSHTSNPRFQRCIINQNTSSNDGGGFYLWLNTAPHVAQNIILDNCLITENQGDTGGGICVRSEYVNIRNCTISRNSSTSGGGGIAADESINILNTIVEGNSGDAGISFSTDASGSTINFSDFADNQGEDFYGTGIPTNLGVLTTVNANGDSCDVFHNIFEDPVFFDPGSGDFHLQVPSRCIGAGDPTSYLDPDIEGNPRPNPPGTNPDIGAYESPEDIPSGGNFGFVTLIHWGPPDWGYRLNWSTGLLSRLVFTNYCLGTVGSLSGNAAYSWSMLPNGDGNDGDSIIFIATIPLTSESTDTFWLSHPTCSGDVDWLSGESSGSIEGPLPVELTTFEAIAYNDLVQLHWETASETDNDHFVLYKKVHDESDFSPIAQIPGQGTTTQSHQYNYTDYAVINGITYQYRISDVDINGIETIHDIIVSATPQSASTVPVEYALHQNYPNPFNPTTTIRYNVKTEGLVRLQIFNLMGQQVATLVDEVVSAGSHTITWDASDLPSGIYCCRMDAGDFHQVKKLLLLK